MMPEITLNPKQDIQFIGGLYFRSINLKSGQFGMQHTHNHDHATVILKGRVRLWIDNGLESEYEAGDIVEVKAHKSHVFEALEESRITCVWPESLGG